MISKEYYDEVMQKKIDSLKQLDRIEFNSINAFHITNLSRFNNIMNFELLSLLLCFFFSLFFVIKYAIYSLAEINLIAELYYISFVGAVCIGTICLIVFLLYNIRYSSERKKIQESNKKFLEEHK